MIRINLCAVTSLVILALFKLCLLSSIYNPFYIISNVVQLLLGSIILFNIIYRIKYIGINNQKVRRRQRDKPTAKIPATITKQA